MDHVVFIQKNTLDLRNRTLKIEAHNESFHSRIIVNEHCLYSVSFSVVILSLHWCGNQRLHINYALCIIVDLRVSYSHMQHSSNFSLTCRSSGIFKL